MTDRTDQVSPDAWDALPQEIRRLIEDAQAAFWRWKVDPDAPMYIAATDALASALLPTLLDRERMDWLEKQLRDTGDHLPSGWAIGDVMLYGNTGSVSLVIPNTTDLSADTLREAIDTAREAR